MEEGWQTEFAEADCYEVRGSVVAQRGAVIAGGAIAAGTTLGLSTYPGEREPVRAIHAGYVLALCYDTRRDSTIVAIAPSAPAEA
jgi:hypothetical protein